MTAQRTSPTEVGEVSLDRTWRASRTVSSLQPPGGPSQPLVPAHTSSSPTGNGRANDRRNGYNPGSGSGKPQTATPESHAGHGEQTGHRLGSFLCWAVVFADIGTSVYYVPGILYGQVGRLAGLFVTLTLLVFLLLTLKYAEATVRFP